MKKIIGFLLAYMLIIVGCSSDNGGGDVSVSPVDDVAKNIVGKWQLQTILFEDGKEFSGAVDHGVVESREYSKKGSVFINYKLLRDNKWKVTTTNDSFKVSGNVITYIDSRTNKVTTERVVKLTKYELVVFTDIANEIGLLYIHNPNDPVSIEGEGFKVFKRQ